MPHSRRRFLQTGAAAALIQSAGRRWLRAASPAAPTALSQFGYGEVEREWRNGDRIEVEFNIPTGLDVVDPQRPKLVAPVHGPLALFSVGAISAGLLRVYLLLIQQVAVGSTDWQAKTAAGTLTLRPFTAVGEEHYRLYLPVEC